VVNNLIYHHIRPQGTSSYGTWKISDLVWICRNQTT